MALPAEPQLRRQLQSRHWLRLHAWLTALFTLAVMSVVSAALPVLGALLVAVALGAVCDLLVPEADTIAQALRLSVVR